jgi:D-glycero-D-manno-heptose 1,7-bisphosphate phosphatase
MSRAIFLDRDGTLNSLVYYPDTDEWESPRTVRDFLLLPGAVDALKALAAQGWSFIVVSNQPSYAKGKTSLAELQAIDDEFQRQLNEQGVTLQAAYYCHHHHKAVVPELAVNCDCRKPGIGLLLKAQSAHGLDLAQCWFIGDQDADVQCGQRAGCMTIQLNYGPSQSKRGTATALYHCENLTEALGIISASPEIIERNR